MARSRLTSPRDKLVGPSAWLRQCKLRLQDRIDLLFGLDHEQLHKVACSLSSYQPPTSSTREHLLAIAIKWTVHDYLCVS